MNKKIKILTRGQAFYHNFSSNDDVLIVFNNKMDHKFMNDFARNPLVKNKSLNQIPVLDIFTDDITPSYFNYFWFYLLKYTVKIPFIFNIINYLYNINKPIKLQLFDLKTARKLIKFLRDHKNYNIYIACEYGKSRSRTTAYFALKHILFDHYPEDFAVIENKYIFNCLEYCYINRI